MKGDFKVKHHAKEWRCGTQGTKLAQSLQGLGRSRMKPDGISEDRLTTLQMPMTMFVPGSSQPSPETSPSKHNCSRLSRTCLLGIKVGVPPII